jgi:3-polyprenyl-4-hydroxybenzoate decarboxylase
MGPAHHGARNFVPPDQVQVLATCCYNANDRDAPLSRGSFLTSGMVVAPCSMRRHGAIAQGQGEHLVHRAADVILKKVAQAGAAGSWGAAA